jgi:ABC-type dipeptide/oligopeptide/nickel transport system permease component
VRLALGEMASEQAYDRMRAELGLDKPLYIQYFSFLGRLIRLDLGKSVIYREDVTKLLAGKLLNTLELTGSALILSYLFAVPLGVLAAVKRNTVIDYLSMGIAIAGVSIPSFWLGFLLISLFAIQLQWFPIAGYGGIKYLVLPAVTLGFGGAAQVARMTRSSLLEVINQDYIQTAKAKGLRYGTVITKHALKNALIPIVTLLGLRIGWLIGGAVVIEIVFLRPGVGRMLVNAIYMRDFPIVQGVTLILAITVILGNLLADILYAVVNPKVHY